VSLTICDNVGGNFISKEELRCIQLNEFIQLFHSPSLLYSSHYLRVAIVNSVQRTQSVGYAFVFHERITNFKTLNSENGFNQRPHTTSCSPPSASLTVFKIFIYVWLYSPLLELGRFFSSSILYKVGRTPWTGDQPDSRPLPTHRTTQSQNKRTQTSMHWVEFEPTSPAFERPKTVHALDSADTVTGAKIIIYGAE
jgi:hypothetical protein